MSDLTVRLNQALQGRYQVERELGRGGMATVFLAHEPRHGRNVALKVLHPELAPTMGRDRFLREIEIAAGLSHPHILPLLDSGDADGLLFYTMPLVEGGSLRDRLEVEGTLEVAEALRIAGQVASALRRAHERGFVHRDVKPENILLTDGLALVADFGIARAVEVSVGDTRLTETGLALGTMTYMSPEQASGEVALDGRSDLYSLACVLYEMLTGAPPFVASTPVAALAKRMTERPRALRSHDPEIPLFVERAVARALASNAMDRFATVAEFADVLDSGTVVERTGQLRVAVLPPAALGIDEEEEHLVRGLHEALIGELGQRDVVVTGRESVLAYADAAVPGETIARELDVDALVTASLHRVGRELALRVRLLDGGRDEGAWSQEFGSESDRVLDLYRSAGAGLAEALERSLGANQTRGMDTASIGRTAYENYMRGRVHQERFTPEDFNRALEYFEAVIEEVPHHAPAHAGIATVLGSSLVLGLTPAMEGGPRMKQAALRAVRLDPNLAEAHYALASAYSWFDWDWEQAEASFKRAVELDPNSPQIRAFYSHFCGMMLRFDEARLHGDKALEMDPRNPFHQVLRTAQLLGTRQWDEAIASAERALEMDSKNALAYQMHAVCKCRRGDGQEGMASFIRFFQSIGDEPVAAAMTAGLEEGGPEEAACRGAETLVERSRSMFVKPENVSLLFDIAGNIELALDWIERGYEQRDHQIAYSQVTPYSDELRAHPRFRELLERLRFPPVE